MRPPQLLIEADLQMDNNRHKREIWEHVLITNTHHISTPVTEVCMKKPDWLLGETECQLTVDKITEHCYNLIVVAVGQVT